MQDLLNKILHGDCLELMKLIPDGSIDMVLCDLPYGTTRNKWDVIIPFEPLWDAYKRIIKNNGAIVLTANQPFTTLVVASNYSMFKYEWIWQKDNGTGFLNAKKMPLKIHENILVFYKNLPTYNPQMRLGFKPYKTHQGKQSSNYGRYTEGHPTESNGGRFPVDVIKFNRDSAKIHPTAKPVALMEYLIKTYTNENEVVLDNCIGSGTTAVACINTNRNFIGMEKDEQYFNIATKRVNDLIEKNSNQLFNYNNKVS